MVTQIIVVIAQILYRDGSSKGGIKMYKRKTVDCYAIEGFYEGYGWDIECNCEDYKDAKVQLKTYRENVNYPVRIKKWREKIKEA